MRGSGGIHGINILIYMLKQDSGPGWQKIMNVQLWEKWITGWCEKSNLGCHSSAALLTSMLPQHFLCPSLPYRHSNSTPGLHNFYLLYSGLTLFLVPDRASHLPLMALFPLTKFFGFVISRSDVLWFSSSSSSTQVNLEFDLWLRTPERFAGDPEAFNLFIM